MKKKKSFNLFALSLLICLPLTINAQEQQRETSHTQVSKLWGLKGELWTPDSRLPDFSFAGYRRGEESFRIPEDSISIESFGAKGNDQEDDTNAFKQAIKAGEGKVIQVPAGRYLLDDRLEIQNPNIVLRGAGSGQTIFEFTRPLEEISPTSAMTDGGQPTSSWSWGGGLITIGERDSQDGDGIPVTDEAKRGDKKIQIQSHGFQVGDEFVLTLHDDKEQSLVHYLYRGNSGDVSGLRNWKCQQVFRVTNVNGNKITLDRGLRFDVHKKWKPSVQLFTPAVTDVGIEGITFDFPAEQYQGHFKEIGYNPVQIGSSAAHCWLRDIHVHNADSGPYIRGFFCTIDGIRFTADEARVSERGHAGHHGVTFLHSNDCLCTNFVFETKFIHDLTVQSAIGSGFEKGHAVDLNMDHHRWAPYENLFTDIDAGKGNRFYSSSGGGMRGHHTAAGETFWNIRADKNTGWPSRLGIDDINVIAVQPKGSSILEKNGRWYEAISPENVQPANLYRAMLERRLHKQRFLGPVSGGTRKPRVIVTTDHGTADYDDIQSLGHLFIYADVLDIRGLIESEPRRKRDQKISYVVDAYEKDYPNLITYSKDYPTPEYLRSIIIQGNIGKQPKAGYSKPSDGSRLIIEEAKKATPDDPLWVLVWGAITDVAQALHDDPSIKSSLRVYFIASWNRGQDLNATKYVENQHKDLWFIKDTYTHRGPYQDEDGDKGAPVTSGPPHRSWCNIHIKGHGALGDMIMAPTGPEVFLNYDGFKAGDSASVYHLLHGNMDDPGSPSWSGEFQQPDPVNRPNYWADKENPRSSVMPWRQDIFEHFALRMDRAQSPRNRD